MAKDDFIELYRTWPDEKLIGAFKRRGDYQQEAIDAMTMVLTERNLGKQAGEIVQADQKVASEKQVQKQIDLGFRQHRYEEKMLGVNMDDVSFAKKARGTDGVYASVKIHSGKYRPLRIFAGGLGITALSLFCIGLGLRPLFPNAQAVFAAATVFLFILVFNSTYASKASFRLFENTARKPEFELVHGSAVYTAKFPFTYSVYQGEMVLRTRPMKITHPLLYLEIECGSEKILLIENLSALQEAPPTWPALPFAKSRKSFTQAALQKMELIRLKKILDGLHQQAE